MKALTKLIPITILALTAAACDGSKGTAPPDAVHNHSASLVPTSVVYDSDLGNAVHAAAARYHTQVQATKDGYVESSPCISSPAGGMGFHWVNNDLVDPVFDAMHPEAVLYAPDEKGKMRLVAVEYIVIDTGQTAPTFAGQAFDVGGTPVPVAHWSLHVWLYKNNPNGLFTPFNPDVVCPA